MFWNYLKITFRNLLRKSLYSITNITGLSIGIACSILILLWVSDELSYDKFLPDADRLYKVYVNTNFDNQTYTWDALPLPTYKALKIKDSNITTTAIADRGEEHLLTAGEKKLIMKGIAASEDFLNVFEFSLITGKRKNILDDPSSIVITETAAKALFGEENAMGQAIRVDDKEYFSVVGILKDIPQNSSFDFDYLLPWRYKMQNNPGISENEDRWYGYYFPVYVKLNDPTRETDIENNIRHLLSDNGMGDIKPELFLHPMSRWRLYSRFENGIEKGGFSDYVQLFSLIAVFIIIIACINFINLSTARSERRAKEVGIRKSAGSTRLNLVIQFLTESMITSLIAYIIAIFIAQLVLPYYNNMVEKELIIDYQSWVFITFSIAIILVTGLVSGSYPAIYLSSFKPIKVLKGKVQVGRNASLPRKVLVTLQFGFSILLIIGTIVIYEQIQLIKNRHLGYNQANLISVELNDELSKNYEVIKNELLQTGVVEAATVSNSPITRITMNQYLGWPGKPEDEKIGFANVTCQFDYTKTLEIKMLEGRDFSPDFVSDSTAIIINKVALDVMQLEDPLGTELDLGNRKLTLIGIIDNVLMESPYHDVRPLFMILGEPDGVMSIRLRKTDDLQASFNKIEKVFNKYNSAYPFEYSFVDVEFEEKFSTINMTSRLASLFALLTVLITGLGLFGLAAYTAEQRTKEIGIRKVMGASVLSIITLMSNDFSRLVIIAFGFSAPIAWWLLNSYLERYQVRIEIQLWILPLTGLFALLFALSIVISQALKAAHTNPAQSLRDE